MVDRVLIVEDDPDISVLLQVNLAELGYPIDHFSDGKEAYQAALGNDYIIMLLDITLPSMSGLDICREIRQAKPHQSIIMLTAKNSETDHVLGLELGADDYMTKPFSIPELQARVRAQLRKTAYLKSRLAEPLVNKVQATITVGELSIYPEQHKVSVAEQDIELTATEFELLHYLITHQGQVFSRAQLLESVWGYTHSGYEHTVNSTMNRLRGKIEPIPESPKYIHTVWGVGYKFV